MRFTVNLNAALKIEEPGMTLRDYFAGQALAGICTRNLLAFDTSEIAKLAYDVADAMLEKRRQNE